MRALHRFRRLSNSASCVSHFSHSNHAQRHPRTTAAVVVSAAPQTATRPSHPNFTGLAASDNLAHAQHQRGPRTDPLAILAVLPAFTSCHQRPNGPPRQTLPLFSDISPKPHHIPNFDKSSYYHTHTHTQPSPVSITRFDHPLNGRKHGVRRPVSNPQQANVGLFPDSTFVYDTVWSGNGCREQARLSTWPRIARGIMDNSYGAPSMSSTSGSKSPLNLSFFKNLNPEKKQTKDGQAPKRRGPKPDSKPALTRRQELNRQAQRTHRERKELYIKALEQEVLRLKETFAQTARERDAVNEENRKLKDLLIQHGISYDFGSTPIKFQHAESAYVQSSSASISGSYQGTSDSTGLSPPNMPNQMTHSQHYANIQTHQARNMAQMPTSRLDYDSIGIDFVLTLERPCMDHMQYLLVRSHNPEGQEFHHPMESPDDGEVEHISGHVLMGTSAPWSHIKDSPKESYPHQMPADLSRQSLAKLLDLSARLPIDREGEITPIMAWTMIFTCQRVGQLVEGDFERLKNGLAGKVRCYGFGAVLEEFEVRDALNGVLAEKDIVPAMSKAMFVSAELLYRDLQRSAGMLQVERLRSHKKRFVNTRLLHCESYLFATKSAFSHPDMSTSKIR
ncbi:hypothetical protein BST61_g9515 [Cercospora zeina]